MSNKRVAPPEIFTGIGPPPDLDQVHEVVPEPAATVGLTKANTADAIDFGKATGEDPAVVVNKLIRAATLRIIAQSIETPMAEALSLRRAGNAKTAAAEADQDGPPDEDDPDDQTPDEWQKAKRRAAGLPE